MGGVWGCFHISAPQPKAKDAAGLVSAVFAPLVTRIFRRKKRLHQEASDENNAWVGGNSERACLRAETIFLAQPSAPQYIF